jgi:hypothetical protein
MKQSLFFIFVLSLISCNKDKVNRSNNNLVDTVISKVEVYNFDGLNVDTFVYLPEFYNNLNPDIVNLIQYEDAFLKFFFERNLTEEEIRFETKDGEYINEWLVKENKIISSYSKVYAFYAYETYANYYYNSNNYIDSIVTSNQDGNFMKAAKNFIYNDLGVLVSFDETEGSEFNNEILYKNKLTYYSNEVNTKENLIATINSICLEDASAISASGLFNYYPYFRKRPFLGFQGKQLIKKIETLTPEGEQIKTIEFEYEMDSNTRVKKISFILDGVLSSIHQLSY